MRYDEMTTEDVVEYFNSEMKKGRTAKEIEIKDFGVSERAIRKRLSRKGIRLDIPKGDYSKSTKIISNNISNNLVVRERKQDNKSDTLVIDKTNNKSITSVINEVIDVKAVNELTSLIEPLKELLQKYHNSNYIIDIDPNDFKVKPAQNVKSKVFKIDIDVLNELDEFCNIYSQYKLQDIVSTLLLEAMSKYK